MLTDNFPPLRWSPTQVLGMPTAEANTQVNIWMGTCYVTPILGAIVADSYLGRYKTIMLFSSFYLVGLLLLAATNLAVDRTNLSWSNVNFMLFAALYIIAVGTGGIKPNVSSFGADQFDETDAGQKRDKVRVRGGPRRSTPARDGRKLTQPSPLTSPYHPLAHLPAHCSSPSCSSAPSQSIGVLFQLVLPLH